MIADVLPSRIPATSKKKSIAELLACDDAEIVLAEPPYRTALVCCWPYFRLYLLNLIWAVPLLPFVDDWTWTGLCKITAACAGVGFSMGFLASVIYHLTPSAGGFRGWAAIILAAPSAVLPILFAVSDGPEMLALAWRNHLFTAWISALVAYTLTVGSIGFVTSSEAESGKGAIADRPPHNT